MSIVRVGSSAPYAAGWDHIFGGKVGSRSKPGSKKTGKATKARKTAAKTAGTTAARTTAGPKVKAAKGKTGVRKPARAKRKK